MQQLYRFKQLMMSKLMQNSLPALLLLMLNFAVPLQAAQSVSAVRIWPAEDYTRITLESKTAFKFSMIEIPNPDRIVLDIEDADINEELKSISSKVIPNDPFIKGVRLGRFKANVVRLVVDLKAKVRPKIINLPPAGNYHERLVLDIYPQKDSLMSMLDARDGQSGKQTASIKPVNNEVMNQASLAKIPPQEKSSVFRGKPKKNREIVIAIDAGHGGEDPGAIGANGSYEKDVTLKLAKKLKEKIDKEPNMRAVLTRDGDYFIPLRGRVMKARKLQADLFVSIHADAAENRSARGSSVFALSERGATSASARYLAQKENESDLIGGVSLDDKDPILAKTLLDLSQTVTINDSLKLGESVLGQISKINRLHKNQVEQAGFAVLKSPDIPSILVETAYISNPEEERKLNSLEYQHQLSNSILSGIKTYFSSNPALARVTKEDRIAKE